MEDTVTRHRRSISAATGLLWLTWVDPWSVPCVVSADRPDMIGPNGEPGLVARTQHLGIRGWLPGYHDNDDDWGT